MFLKSILYIILFWFIWRWLDRIFGNRRRNTYPTREGDGYRAKPEPHSKSKKPNDDSIGDYVEFEEVED
jgi:hypothetical protein